MLVLLLPEDYISLPKHVGVVRVIQYGVVKVVGFNKRLCID
jgi:hypothetical protein